MNNKIYDCITFFQETLQAELRINILKDVVDFFVVCESNYDHRGRSKKINFDVPLNPKGTIFQKKVWKQLSKIPYGKTISYLDLAKQLGDAKTIRAAASANGKNPLWIIVPCHRVIRSDGTLGGFSSPGGIKTMPSWD